MEQSEKTELEKIGDEIFGAPPKQDVVTEEAMAELTAQKPAAPAVRPPPAALIPADARGVLVGTTLEHQYRLAKYYAISGLMPQHFRTPEQVLVAMQYLRELGLPVMASIRQTMVINGTPSIWGDLPLAIAIRTGELESIEEFLLDKNMKPITLENGNLKEELYAAVCRIRRKGVSRTVEAVFTLDDAVRAGLANKDLYKKYPKRMYKYRARSMALKDIFTDALSGVFIAEYDAHITGDVGADAPVLGTPDTKAQELTARFTRVDSPPNSDKG